MNALIIAFVFAFVNVLFATPCAAVYPRAYNVTINLGVTKFDSVDGKFIFDLMADKIKYSVPLNANNIKLEYNKSYSYVFAAPYDVTQINELQLGWERKFTIGSLFTNKKIYVSSVVLDPSYMPISTIRQKFVKKFCPFKPGDGIKSKEVIALVPC